VETSVDTSVSQSNVVKTSVGTSINTSVYCVCQNFKVNIVVLDHVNMEEQIADIFTKALDAK
jgi:hypothetical protein